MKLEIEPEEAKELLDLIVGRLIAEADFSDEDRATLRRWRSESMKTGSDGMRELTAKINTELERVLRSKAKSPFVKPDWK